jgi:DNA-binding NarL/FixJ family response regulator
MRRGSCSLTPREKQVIALIAQGYSDKQIAVHLMIARSTVSNHVCAILLKLDAATRAQAVAVALGAETLQGSAIEYA